MKLWLSLGALTTTCTAAPLQIEPEQRHFITADGQPFLWLGDTAWELFHRLDRDEARHYLTRRAEQGFTVIQAVVLAESDGLRTPNAYGQVPFHDLDPRRPNEAYFTHVDFIVAEAAQRGLHLAILPTWGDKVPNERGGHGPVVFNIENARDYGRFLGARYREAPVIWMLGGDRPVDGDEAHAIWRSMAQGLREAGDGRHLITYHPAGEETSAAWFHNESWLDFNVFQSGHAMRFHPVYRYAAELALMQPRKPFLDAEPPYEDIPLRFWDYLDWEQSQPVPADVLDANGLIANPDHFPLGFFDDHDVRVHAYWNLLAGGAGYTYGNNAVWQMHRVGERVAIPCLHDWRTALERPGAQQLRHLRDLFERRSFALLQPDQSMVYGPNPDGPRHVRAALAETREFALVYVATGRPVDIVLGKIRGSSARVTWWDPRTGEANATEELPNAGRRRFTPPRLGEKADWVLVIDAGDAELPPLDGAGE